LLASTTLPAVQRTLTAVENNILNLGSELLNYSNPSSASWRRLPFIKREEQRGAGIFNMFEIVLNNELAL
jgi:hypothetical protein